MILFLKGIIIGFGKIIPGVSGAVIAISLGVYKNAIDAINNIFKDKKNFTYLLILGLGIIISIVFGSNIINYLLKTCYLLTMLLFIGLMIGGIPSLFLKVKGKFNKKIVLIVILLMIFTLFFDINKVSVNIDLNNKFIIFLLGIIDSITMIIPGISGSAVLMLLNSYEFVLESISSIDINILIPFIFGLLTGVILLIKLINYILKKYEILSYTIILIFMLISILMLLLQCFSEYYNLYELIVSLMFLNIGIFIGYKLDTL